MSNIYQLTSSSNYSTKNTKKTQSFTKDIPLNIFVISKKKSSSNLLFKAIYFENLLGVSISIPHFYYKTILFFQNKNH